MLVLLSHEPFGTYEVTVVPFTNTPNELDGKQVTDPDSMRTLIVALVPGKQITLKLKRGPNELELPLQVGKRPKAQRSPE